MGKLTATGVKQAKGQSKATKLPDGGGMYLLLKPNGGKYWRYDYRYAHKRKTLALGVYPEISLADARKAHHKVRGSLQAITGDRCLPSNSIANQTGLANPLPITRLPACWDQWLRSRHQLVFRSLDQELVG
jgi:hypothetical protein